MSDVSFEISYFGFQLSYFRFAVSDFTFNPLRAVRRARFGTSFSTTLVPFLSRLSLLGVTFGGLEMQLSAPKTDFGAQGAP